MTSANQNPIPQQPHHQLQTIGNSERVALLSDIWSTLNKHGIFPNSSLNPELSRTGYLRIESAIMDEKLLPPAPAALVEGIIEEGGKTIISGAPKAWKSFLMISLAIAVAAGTTWLGADCKQGAVAYVNLEIGSAQFARRVFDMASKSGVNKKLISENLSIVSIDGYMNMSQLADELIAHEDLRNCQLIIIDPLYKVFSGSENSQEDMAAFFAQVDRITRAIGCAVVVVHHHSKGFQGLRDVVDRACGSNVLGRDPDTIISIDRINTSGNALRASFEFRGFEERDPIDYWFKYPQILLDSKGVLNKYQIGMARTASRTKKSDVRQKTLDETCEELMQGRHEFKRKELQNRLGWKSETIDKYLKSSARFKKAPTKKNICVVQRK